MLRFKLEWLWNKGYGPKSETKTFPSFFLGVTPIFGATEVTPKLGATLFRCDTLFGVTHSEQRGKDLIIKFNYLIIMSWGLLTQGFNALFYQFLGNGGCSEGESFTFEPSQTCIIREQE